MKEYKTINKKPDINKFPLQRLNINIQGKILYVTSTPSPNKKTFILTDKSSFYVIENNNFQKPKEYALKSEILARKTLNSKSLKFQTDPKETTDPKDLKNHKNLPESQIWSDKKGNHVIIKYKNVTFYYNPYMMKKVEELQLIPPGNTLIQPYAVVFNEDEVEKENTGIVLLSDYNSSIYELQLFLSDKKEMMRSRFGEILKLKPTVRKRRTTTEFEMNFFDMDKDDRITELKLFKEKNKLLIMAITKRILFQFVGKKDLRGVFDNYDVDNGNIMKAVKKFFKKSRKNELIKNIKNGEKGEITRTEIEERESFKYSRIQLIKKESENDLDSFGFMSDCGYITGNINKDLKPQNKFNVLKYFKISIDNKEKAQIVHQLMPKSVCESKFHKFFLYSDYLVVQSKLTNGIKHDEYLPYKFIDMFYDEDSIIIYNEDRIYKISLENEYKNLYEDYIEKGDYKKALELTKDDKYLIPMIHKIYADHLFKDKKYLDAALEYAFSNEIFENVCIKFLSINSILGLIRYFILIIKFRLYNSKDSDNKEDKKVNPREQFIDKFLIYTWLLELIIEKNENENNENLIKQIREISRYEKFGSKFLDSNLLYYLLNIFNKLDELIEFAGLKKDNDTIITSLINRNKIDQTLEQFKMSLFGDENELDIKLKNSFYKYGNILIKENIKSTIDLLSNYFRPEKPEELIRILISPNFNLLSEDEKNYKKLLEYIKDLTRKPYKIGKKEINLTKNENLNNLYILLVSYSKPENYKIALFNDLKNTIKSFINNQQLNKKGEITDKIYFDLNFAKKIFKDKKDQYSLKILCLIYYILNQYFDCIDIALENNFEDLILDLTKNIQEKKLRKKILLKIFQYEKEHRGLSEAKKIINNSKDMIQIEDVIPLMGDDEKLIELKDELMKCIENSEKIEISLNKEIKDFNESNNSINKDIELSEKKAIKKKYTELKCSKCDKNINSGKNIRFFLFPCQHIFDLQCLIDTYMEFNFLNSGDEKQKEALEIKIGVIKDLSAKIEKMELKKSRALEGKEKFEKEEEFALDNNKKLLYDYLNDECLLCGQKMVDSTQMEFGTDDKFEWDLI